MLTGGASTLAYFSLWLGGEHTYDSATRVLHNNTRQLSHTSTAYLSRQLGIILTHMAYARQCHLSQLHGIPDSIPLVGPLGNPQKYRELSRYYCSHTWHSPREPSSK